MKKNRNLIIVLAVILIICYIGLGIIFSFDNKIDKKNNKVEGLLLTCDSDTIRLNEEVICTLKGNVTDYKVSAVSAKIDESPNFEVIDVSVDSIWQGDGEDNFIALYTDENKSNTFNVATFNISLVSNDSESIDINISEIIFTDENYKEHVVNDITKRLVIEK